MLYSMTGFGRAEATIANRQVSVEIKSLNGKQFDINAKLPYVLRAWELDVRSLLANLLQRGTADITVTLRQGGSSRPMSVNMDLAAFYYQSMKDIAERFDLPKEQILSTIMSMPEIVSADHDVLPEEDWLNVKEVIIMAAQQLMQHRSTEGTALETELLHRLSNIENLHEKILPLEPVRKDRIKQRLQQALSDMGSGQADANRFEQELIYYIEKIDFTEEKTRLKQHCIYFRETIAKPEISKGKVLGFILQEIGREINTLGAKANDAVIQQIVVTMKDELEKMKEQVLNVL